jgi:CDGSH-type Zn-finger protein
VVADGPYLVIGARLVRMRPVYDEAGNGVEWERGAEIPRSESYELCRCGRSATKPFCDGAEKLGAFDGSEVADRSPTDQRRRVCSEAPIVLTDDRSLCAHAAFCQRGSTNAWTLAREAEDPETRAVLVAMVRRCPSGRLQYRVVPDLEPTEERLEPEVAVVDDGPLWVRGGIPIRGADGFEYEVRNRVTLCRCGHSSNKPFCDGSHWEVGFTDP